MDRFNRPTLDVWTRFNPAVGGLSSSYDASVLNRTIAYDKNSNILSIDHAKTGLDRLFTIDGLARVPAEDRGELLNATTLNATVAYNNTTYDHLGNWRASLIDLNNDRDFTDPGEFNRSATFTIGNEQTPRSDLPPSFVYDKTGQMTDDAETYTYVYDAWGRLVEVATRGGSPSTVSNYRYNALGHRIAWQHDTDADGTVETTGADDPWTYALYIQRWQLISQHTADDGTPLAGAGDDPDKLFIHHQGASSYIDSMILSDVDSTGDGVFDERTYYVQNWRHDVVARAETDGDLIELAGYTPYGKAIDLLEADFGRGVELWGIGRPTVRSSRASYTRCNGERASRARIVGADRGLRYPEPWGVGRGVGRAVGR